MQLRLHYTDRGSGAPLLLRHGGLGIGDDWRHVFPVDPPGFGVVVPDLRGHGQSWHGHATFSIRECAHDVLALVDALGIARVRAIGLSLGAKTLLPVATAQPNRVEAMVLVSATQRFPMTMRDMWVGDALARPQHRRHVVHRRIPRDDYRANARRPRRSRSARSGRARDRIVPRNCSVIAVGRAQRGHGPIFGASATTFAATAIDEISGRP